MLCFVSHLIYLSLTKNTMQQYFHPKCETFIFFIQSAKSWQARSQGGHSGAVLPVTDLRIGQIGHGLGPRANRSYDDSLFFIERLKAVV